jgi:hypothetical protein
MRFLHLFLLTLVTVACASAAKVQIIKQDGRYQILRDGQPYFIKGAVGGVHLDQLAAAGGNSTRAGVKSLDEAHRHGLSVLVNLPLGNQRHGFDYKDAARVEQQRTRIRDIVEQNRSHPAVLMWAIGNEPEIHTTPEQRREVYAEVNRIAAMIHKLDPDHPVITVIGGDYKRGMLRELKEQCPELDAIGLNAYKIMLTMPEDVAEQAWEKPYVVTEFGPIGHWQVAKTPWKIPIEDTSSEKAAFYEKAYRHAVMNRPNCLGSYVFYWNQKQEKTHTWYGMFFEDGTRTEAIDVMTRLWSGKEPANRTPTMSRIRVTSPAVKDHIYDSGALLECEVASSDPDGDKLDIRWEVRPDVGDNPNVGGDFEPSVKPIDGCVKWSEGGKARIALPEKPANYRVFVYSFDGRGSAGYANLPVRVGPLK